MPPAAHRLRTALGEQVVHGVDTRRVELQQGEPEAAIAEYRRAPEVTRRRLYLETMELVLPGVDKVIVEPDTVQLMPFFPLQGQPPEGRSAPAPSPPAPGVASPPEQKP